MFYVIIDVMDGTPVSAEQEKSKLEIVWRIEEQMLPWNERYCAGVLLTVYETIRRLGKLPEYIDECSKSLNMYCVDCVHRENKR